MEFSTEVWIDEGTPRFARTFWIHNVKRPGGYDCYLNGKRVMSGMVRSFRFPRG